MNPTSTLTPISFLSALQTYLQNRTDTTDEPVLPIRDSLYIVIPVTVIYMSIFITGTVGNISTCIVIARNKSMHTATNFYLFSLAVSDLLLLFSGLPAEIYMIWFKYPYIFGEVFCVLRGLAAETSTNASVLTITAFTIERYLAICHPFLSQTMSKLMRVVRLIFIIWLMGLLFALPLALQIGIVQNYNNPKIVMCTVKRVLVRYSFELSTFFFFVIPMALLMVLYALIGLKLKKSNMMKKSRGNGESGSCKHQPGKTSKRVLRMLVAVVIAFFVCWAPFHIQRLIATYGMNSEDHTTSNNKFDEFFYALVTYISGVLYYVSTSINPILYNIMSNKFRVAFMETLSRNFKIPGLTVRTGQRSYSSLPRSQQRAIGFRNVGTAGTGIVNVSTDCSGNSGHHSNLKQNTRTLTEHVNVELTPTNVDLTPTNVDLTLTNVDLTLTNVDLTLTNVDLTPTNVDLTLTNVDLTPTNVDLTPTNVDLTLTNVDLTPTNVDLTLTNVDLTPTIVDLTLTNVDLTPTNVDLTLTNVDLTPTIVDLTLTNVDLTPTNVDLTLTNVDLTPTIVDLTLTNVDLTPTNVDLTLTNVDLTPTNVDLTLTNVDLTPTIVDLTLTNVDLTPTNVDLTLTNVDLTPTIVDLTLTNVDLTPTNVDLTPTNVDLMPTNVDLTPTNVDKKGNEDIETLEDSKEIKDMDVDCCNSSRKSSPVKYDTVKLSNVNESGKKRWHLLEWSPRPKSLKLAQRSLCTVPENSSLGKSELGREEISMTLWNETNEQNTV